MSIGSIFVKHNPVTLHERYLLNLSPLADGPGFMDAGFDEYRPAERAEGGFWGTSFRVFARENVLKELFQNGLGRHVEAWGQGLLQDFEGYIDAMTFNLPPDQFSISLESMANQIWMRADTNADGVVERTTTKTSAESQDRFGIKDLVLSGGEIIGLATANQAVQTFLDLKAFPRPEARIGGAGGDRPSLEIFCRGYIHTLGWRVYNSTSPTGIQSLTSQVKAIVGDRAVAADPLLTSLIAWWDMEESGTSDSRIDAHGVEDLTVSGTGGIPGVAGLRGNAADLERADGDLLSRVDNAQLSVADIDFSLLCWVKLESLPSAAGAVFDLMTKGANPTSFSYRMYLNTSDRLVFEIKDSGGTTRGLVESTNVSPLLTGQWYMLRAWHDSVSNLVGVSVGLAAGNTSATTGAPYDDGNNFVIGHMGVAAGSALDGLVDSAAFWKRLLTDSDVNRLYSAGLGMNYAMLQQAVIESGVGQFVAIQDRDTNTTSVTREYDADRKAFEILFDLVRLGDTNFNRWLLYMVGRSATEPVGRKLVLRQAAPAEITV